MFIEQPRRVDYFKPVSQTQTDLHMRLQLVVRNYDEIDADDHNSPYSVHKPGNLAFYLLTRL